MATDYLTMEQSGNLCNDAVEILKMLTSSTKTAKNNIKLR